MQPLPRGPVTDGIALLTALAWIAALVFGLATAAPMIAGFIPALFSGATLELPASFAAWQVPPSFTPLSATLVHGGFLHLAMNMITLLFCGRIVEHVLGGWGVLFLYLVGAYAAASAQYFANPASQVPMVGASGAISALVGAYAMLFSRKRAKRIGPIPGHYVHVLWLAAAWAAIQWLTGFAMSAAGAKLAVAAHIGGFLAGLMFARSLLAWRFRNA
jgi:membrane associated rhomboid family serine protease